MRKSRFNEEQMVAIPCEADRMSVGEAAKKHRECTDSGNRPATGATQTASQAHRGTRPCLHTPLKANMVWAYDSVFTMTSTGSRSSV